MKLKTLWIVVALLIVLLPQAHAQKGAVFVEHYGNPIANLTTQNKAIVQTLQGDMLIANAQGVVHYNGHQWQRIDVKATVYDLLTDSATVFTAGRMSFGYLKRNPTGQLVYASLTTTHKKLPKRPGNFYSIGKTNQHIYFLSKKLLVEVDKKKLKVTRFWQSQPQKPYQGLVTFQNKVFVNIAGEGLHQLGGKKLTPTLKGSKGAKFKDIQITSAFASKYLPFFTASDNFVYRYDGTLWQKLVLQDQKYLHEHTLTTGNAIGEKYLALGTLDAGVLVVEANTGKTLFVINDQTGLPDDEILAIGVDQQLGLWIAHSLGISRAALNVPVKGFGHYPGLLGSMTAVTHWQDKVYVATNEGVFYLHKTETYAELIKHITHEKVEKKKPVVTKIVTEVGGGTVVGNLINKAFGRKKKKRVIYRKVPQRQVKTATSQVTKELLQKRLYNLRSFPYFYQKVAGFDGKVTQLLALPNQLLIASNNGLYSYQNKRVKLVLPKVYVHHLLYQDELLLVATSKGLISLQNKASAWVVHDRFSQLKLPVYSVAKIKNNLWLGSENKAAKVQLSADNHYQRHQVFELPQYYLENVQVANLQNKPVLFLSDGVYRFNVTKKQFERDRLLKMLNLPYQTIQHQDKHIWTNFRGRWVDMQSLKTTQYLSLFTKISDIYQDKQGFLWVIHDNGLHKLGLSYTLRGKRLNVLVNRVFDHQNKDLPFDKIRVHQGTKAYGVNIRLKVPYYLNETSVEYQYRMKGGKKGWSKWQSSPLLTFNMLPRGKHTIEVRARNGLGEESRIKEVKVKIIPPFWKTWWFYLIEVLVLLSLVFASAASSRFQKFERYSYILTFVTIITVFEFIVLSLEPSVDEFSGGVPVFKLFMNIILAISLNPIERKLAMWLSKSKHRKYN
ncbi:triple tyrosine motif-containing protein [Microscilla marina]|uniref:triple tyrosine motif-containing protein n=1 Tax=Microscilla marina TaxID=1027 RepID=UPI00030CC4D0|nr:triple tyrosine motif-containing protein [Microscilla marina]